MGATNLFLDSILLDSFCINGKVFISFRECSEKVKNWLKSTLKVTAFDFTYKKHTNKLIHFNLLMNLLINGSCKYDSDQG